MEAAAHGTPYRSFGAQGKHFLTRSHTGVPDRSVDGPAAWRNADLQNQVDRWRYTLTEPDISELLAAVGGITSSGISLAEVSRENFPLPTLSPKIRTWQDEIMRGVGLKYVRGLPIDNMSHDEIDIAFWGIGHHLGIPGAQNPDNELLGHVTDYGESADDPFVRLYRTSANIRYHCDAADIVGLLCLHPAKSGGQSRIVSTVTLFNLLLESKPDLAARLFEPFRMDRRGETRGDDLPYSLIPPCQYADGQLRTFYHSDYYRSVERHPGIQLTDDQRAILDFYDEVGMEPENHIDMWLEKGDMQFISNHTTAHARTQYEDFEEPDKKRHLLRLWLSAE